MHRFIFPALLLSLLAAVGPSTAAAQEPAKGKIRVLLTYGGHDFEKKAFFAMLDSLPGVVYTTAEMPKAADKLNPSLKKDYDVIVMYDMVREFTPEQQKAFVELLESGIGLISLHHNLGANQGWQEFPRIIGGRYVIGESVIDGKKYGPSNYADDQNHNVTVVDRQHPITADIKDFKMRDEAYGRFYTAPDVKVLLTSDCQKNDPPVAWVKQYGKSRVFYLMFGHGRSAWENPNYRRILANAVRWVAEK